MEFEVVNNGIIVNGIHAKSFVSIEEFFNYIHNTIPSEYKQKDSYLSFDLSQLHNGTPMLDLVVGAKFKIETSDTNRRYVIIEESPHNAKYTVNANGSVTYPPKVFTKTICVDLQDLLNTLLRVIFKTVVHLEFVIVTEAKNEPEQLTLNLATAGE